MFQVVFIPVRSRTITEESLKQTGLCNTNNLREITGASIRVCFRGKPCFNTECLKKTVPV